MGMPIPANPAERTVFGEYEKIKNHPDLLFTEPVGYAALYVLADTKDKMLWTNCVTNDQGQVCTTNFSEVFTDFEVLNVGDTPIIKFAEEMERSVDSGVLCPASRMKDYDQ